MILEPTRDRYARFGPSRQNLAGAQMSAVSGKPDLAPVVLDFRVRLIAEVTIRSALGYSRRAPNQSLIELFSIVQNALAALA
jgi:hypothetical protein